MHAPARRTLTAMAASAAFVLVASPATAHPSFNPNQLTAGESHDIDFVIPHGCVEGGGAPEEGEEASPTIQVSVQTPREVLGFTAASVPGWEVSTINDGVTFRATDGGTTAPIVLPVTVEVSGDVGVGETVYFTVAQDCSFGSTLWQAKTGEDGDPAAILEIAESIGTADHGDGDHGDGDMDHGSESEHDVDGEMTTDHGSDGEHDADGEDVDGDHAMDDAAAESEGDPLAALSIVMAFVVFGGIFLILRSGGGQAE